MPVKRTLVEGLEKDAVIEPPIASARAGSKPGGGGGSRITGTPVHGWEALGCSGLTKAVGVAGGLPCLAL